MSATEQTERIDNATPSDNPNNNNNEVNQNINKDEVSDVSPSSGVSSGSSKSAVSKQSGIRPPSRIGRPCAGIQKPAIPATPTKNSSDDSIRRLTDDFGRHKLTDLMEADESEEDGLDYIYSSARRNRYTSLGSTASSMDGLWELHPRRLSEAGLSRHSDSSAVLTEDTDSFIIGQRVWVGGSKPGTIAYIGETQFAPGEWAGIALDEPIGKNDGSVGGIKYFQCESKKGVFSRLTRLTRVPLEQPGMGSNETFVTTNNGVRRSPISPTGSTKGFLQSAASLSISNTSLSSTATHIDFKIGDRVIIKSTQGSKVGTVRYMGLTDFAPGEWVGVELDDPRGKNDGAVEGRRYFECRPNFGLFAPVSKVSKSPSKHKPSACVVHSGPGLPPSGLRRANSKESMTSMVSKTSVASSVRRKVTPKTTTPIPTRTALQDVLREKQLHIEQLLKERDLERAEITRAASQADDAEHKLLTLTQDFEKYRAECEIRVLQNHELLKSLNVDREKLLNQLEDERRKNEDLQFRFEETSISKSDIEAASENFVKKISQLEANLTDERHKAESLEQTSNKLFEAEESLIKAREEIDSLKHDLEDARNAKATADEKHIVSIQLVESLQKKVEDATIDHEEKSKTINQLNEEISKIKAEHDVTKREVDDNFKEKDEVIAQLKLQLENQRVIIEQHETKQSQLVKDNEKLKMELSAKSLDLETGSEQVSAKDGELRTIRDTLEQVKKELSHKSDDLELHKANSQKVEQELRTELEQTRENLKNKISEVENVKKDYHVQLNQKDEQLQESNKTLTQTSEDLKKVTGELEQVKNNFEEHKKDIQTRHSNQVASQDSQLMALSAELQQKNEEVTKASIAISKLEEDVCSKNGVIEKLRLEVESYESRLVSHNESSVTLTQRMHEVTLMNGDLERQLALANSQIMELGQVKQRLELEIQQLSVKCEGAAQLEQLRNELISKEETFGNVRQNYETKIQSLERSLQQSELDHAAQITTIERTKHELEAKLQILSQSESSLQQRCDSHAAELVKIRDEYRIQINELQQTLQGKELEFNNYNQQNLEAVKHYEEQLVSVKEELNRQLQGCQEKISGLTDENLQIKQQLTERNEQLIEAKAEASHAIAQFQQTEQELNQKCADTVRQMEFELNEKSLQLQQTVTELQLIQKDCQNTNTDISAKDHQIGELTSQMAQAQILITQTQEELNSVRLMYEQTNKEQALAKNQCQDLLEQVTSLTEQVRHGEEVFKSLQVEHNNAMLLVNQLRITEEQKRQCLQLLEHAATLDAENINQNKSVVELLHKMNVDNATESTEKIINLQRDLDIIRNQLAERNNQYDVQQNELLRLQQELMKAEEINSRCASGPQDSNSLLIQDRELADNQIRFLNSIIVDIQKKNEEQRARIEILEAGGTPNFADDLRLLGSESRQLPPRMYCDICEEFDLHETEDCPKQMSEEIPVNGQRVRTSVPDRAYCELCEEFGHATEDCKEDQTF